MTEATEDMCLRDFDVIVNFTKGKDRDIYPVIPKFNRKNNVTPSSILGAIYPFPYGECKEEDSEGGIIVVNYEMECREGAISLKDVVSAFREILKDNEITFLTVHQTGDDHFCYHWCDKNIIHLS